VCPIRDGITRQYDELIDRCSEPEPIGHVGKQFLRGVLTICGHHATDGSTERFIGQYLSLKSNENPVIVILVTDLSVFQLILSFKSRVNCQTGFPTHCQRLSRLTEMFVQLSYHFTFRK
jgi:hypothetical protein